MSRVMKSLKRKNLDNGDSTSLHCDGCDVPLDDLMGITRINSAVLSPIMLVFTPTILPGFTEVSDSKIMISSGLDVGEVNEVECLEALKVKFRNNDLAFCKACLGGALPSIMWAWVVSTTMNRFKLDNAMAFAEFEWNKRNEFLSWCATPYILSEIPDKLCVHLLDVCIRKFPQSTKIALQNLRKHFPEFEKFIPKFLENPIEQLSEVPHQTYLVSSVSKLLSYLESLNVRENLTRPDLCTALGMSIGPVSQMCNQKQKSNVFSGLSALAKFLYEIDLKFVTDFLNSAGIAENETISPEVSKKLAELVQVEESTLHAYLKFSLPLISRKEIDLKIGYWWKNQSKINPNLAVFFQKRNLDVTSNSATIKKTKVKRSEISNILTESSLQNRGFTNIFNNVTFESKEIRSKRIAELGVIDNRLQLQVNSHCISLPPFVPVFESCLESLSSKSVDILNPFIITPSFIQSSKNTSDLIFQCGGPVADLAWCPTSDILAVATYRDSVFHVSNIPYPFSHFISFWDFSSMNSALFSSLDSIPPPTLGLLMELDSSPVKLAWCPRFDSTLDVCGILAVLSLDGSLKLFSVPKFDSSTSFDNVRVTKHAPMWTFYNTNFHLSCFRWHKHEDYLAAGTSEGFTLIWNLSDSKNSDPILSFRDFNYEFPIVALDFYDHYLATISSSGHLHFWDLQLTVSPLFDTLVDGDGIFDLTWLPNSFKVVVASSKGIRIVQLLNSFSEMFKAECCIPSSVLCCVSVDIFTKNDSMWLIVAYSSGYSVAYSTLLTKFINCKELKRSNIGITSQILSFSSPTLLPNVVRYMSEVNNCEMKNSSDGTKIIAERSIFNSPITNSECSVIRSVINPFFALKNFQQVASGMANGIVRIKLIK